MPLALEPNETIEIILESDMEKPPESRPVFIYQVLSGAEFRSLGKVMDGLSDSKDTDEVVTKVYDGVRLGLIGWKNMFDYKNNKMLDFDLSIIENILTIQEAHEIIHKRTSIIGADDKGKGKVGQ